MPDETPGAQAPAQSVMETGSLRDRFDRLAESPYSLLVVMLYIVAASGMAQLITDAFGWPDDAEGLFDGLFNDLWMVAGATAFTLGMLSIVHAMRARNSGEAFTLPAAASTRMLHPVWLFSIAPYVFAGLGLIKLLYDVAVTNWGNVESFFSWTLYLLFFTVAGTFLMFALTGLSDWLRDSGPGESDEQPATAEGKSFTEQLDALTADTDRTLTFGVYLTAYIGLFMIIFTVWNRFDSSAGSMWQTFFYDSSLVGGAVAFLLIARTLINWLRGREMSGGEMGRGEGEDVWRWALRLTNNPMHMVNLATAVVLATGLTFYLVNMWSSRNWDADAFWSQLLLHTVYGLIVVGALLFLRAMIAIAGSGPSSGFRDRLREAAEGPLLNDPGQILRVGIYALAFVGLASVCVEMLADQGAPVWIVWYYFFNFINAMALPIAMAIGAKAVYAEVLGDARAMA